MANLHKNITTLPDGTMQIGEADKTVTITGALKITNTNVQEEGVFSWNPATKKPQYYDGTDYRDFASSGFAAGIFSDPPLLTKTAISGVSLADSYLKCDVVAAALTTMTLES